MEKRYEQASDHEAIQEQKRYREDAMIRIYQAVLTHEPRIDASLVLDVDDPTFMLPVDAYFSDNLKNISMNRPYMEVLIDKFLNDWTFERLGAIEQAIMLLAVSELKMKQVDRRIVLDEAVRLAKKYADDDAYKLINATLDHL